MFLDNNCLLRFYSNGSAQSTIKQNTQKLSDHREQLEDSLRGAEDIAHDYRQSAPHEWWISLVLVSVLDVHGSITMRLHLGVV